MEAFQWNPCFVTGLQDVDDQHHKLVDVINRFGDLVMQQEQVEAQALEAVFAELAQYATYHFVEEEALMESMQLNAHYVAQHHVYID